MSGRRLVALLGAALSLGAALPASASAADAPRLRGDCPDEPGFRCATLRVPLDHAGTARGHLDLRVQRRSTPRRGRTPLIALAGGPGQGATAFATAFAFGLRAARRDFWIVVPDQRGTGFSGPLRCPRLQRLRSLDPTLTGRFAQCATRIGPRRRFYATIDSVEDLELLRRALGVRKIALAGTSYGTWVAMEYARRHPQHTDRLVLDSAIGPDGVDPLLRDSWGRLPRILATQCAGRRCAGITRDPLADLRTLAARLEAAPLRGPVVDGRGRRQTRTLTAGALANLTFAGDLNPHLQAALPAAVRSALDGDPAPIARLVRPGTGPAVGLRELSWALYATTTCADTRLSFAMSDPFGARDAQLAAALAATPEATLGPFSRPLVGHLSIDDACRRWPVERLHAPVDAPLPDVPALILGGTLDVRTPLENDRAVAAQLPRAQLVAVPGSGHDVTSSDLSGCVARALERFFGGGRVGDPCANVDNAVPPQPVAPTALAEVEPAPGTGGRRGRVLAAAVRTLDDTREAVLQSEDSGLFDVRGGGLRGGRWEITSETGYTLRRVVYVPGVRLSGHVDSRLGRYRGRLRVDGPARLDGTLRFLGRRGLRGRIGGERVRLGGRYVRGAVPPSLARG